MEEPSNLRLKQWNRKQLGCLKVSHSRQRKNIWTHSTVEPWENVWKPLRKSLGSFRTCSRKLKTVMVFLFWSMVVLVAWDRAVLSIEFVSDQPIIMPKPTNPSRPYWNKRSTSPFNDFWFYCLNVDLKSRDLKVYRIGFLQVLKWIISKG